MNVQLIVCDGENAEGQPCGQIATVISSRPVDHHSPEGHILPATEYEIDCPACGRRTRVVVQSDG